MQQKPLLALLGITMTLLLQHVVADAITPNSDEYKANMIKKAFKHAWKGYSRYAYGHDELSPMTNGATDSR